MKFAKVWISRGCPLLVTLLCAVAGGCGSGTSPNAPAPLNEKDAIVAALPSGVTLETPIEPDPLFGPSAKTVGDALAGLMAYVRDGKLHDGGMGGEIRFQQAGSPGKSGAKTTDRKAKKGATSYTTIRLAK